MRVFMNCVCCFVAFGNYSLSAVQFSPWCFIVLPSVVAIFRKPSGIRAGRKLRIHRRNQRWNSKQWNKSHSVTSMKANPMQGGGKHTIILIQYTGSYQSRSYIDFPTISAAMDGKCSTLHTIVY